MKDEEVVKQTRLLPFSRVVHRLSLTASPYLLSSQRDTLRQQEGTIKSLREELQRSEVRQGASKTEERLRRENR